MKNSLVLLICGLYMLTAITYSCKKEDPDPPTVTTVSVTQITVTSALGGGDIASDGGSPVTARGVCWSTQPNTSVADAHTSDSSGTGSYASTITGLQPETSYYLRAYATNSAGTAYGQEISFETLEQSGTFTDTRDNKEYKWVRIGDQVWMAENLTYLPSVSPSSGGSYTDPYYYVYGYEGSNLSEAKATDNFNTYGVLYNWPAAMVSCPDGWHLPTDEEWTELNDYLGGESVAGGKLKETGTSHWESPNYGASNETGFTALPGGVRGNGNFDSLDQYGNWWSATENYTDCAWGTSMAYFNSSVYRSFYIKQFGFSLRCLRD
ncbi:MAG: hypothetical protein KFF49_08095 [Bacteroidales bacterium]|nr:hypothetical protein [Bacteroidales bacterium]